MKLLIDAGNSFIKWAVVDGVDWPHRGVLPVGRAGELPQCMAGLKNIQQVWVSNVGGEEIAGHIRAIKTGQGVETRFITSRAEQCGVCNGYSEPARLGSDRWAALIAAWHLVRAPCLVVNSGTATTIDALSGEGEFIGGLILPGVELMQRCLAAATAQLKPERGEYAPFPRNTADALFSGAIQAICGAIMRQYALIGNTNVPVVLSGGATGVLREHLVDIPLRVVDDLVLKGLLCMAQEAGEQ